jgi:hypothetical protein
MYVTGMNASMLNARMLTTTISEVVANQLQQIKQMFNSSTVAERSVYL